MAIKVVVIVLLLCCLNLISSQLSSDPVPTDIRIQRKCGPDYCAAVSCLMVYCENSIPANPSLCRCCPQCLNTPTEPVPNPPIKTCAVDCRLVRCALPKCVYGTIPANPAQCRCCPQCINIPPKPYPITLRPPIKKCDINCKAVMCPMIKCAFSSIPADPSQCRCCPTCSNNPIEYPVEYPIDPIRVPLETA